MQKDKMLKQQNEMEKEIADFRGKKMKKYDYRTNTWIRNSK